MIEIKWGVLSTAKIGTEKVIPAMQQGKHSKIIAIASRNIVKATSAAEKLNIPKAYGSYEELLNDPDVEAVYISLPNHLHVDWTIKCLESGKHVLCEKPLGLNFTDALRIENALKNYPDLKVMEAFMYRFHPQMEKTKKLISSGRIGRLINIQTMFSYFNNNPDDIRNNPDIGGGGLLDIGCYCISISRYLFGSEPKRVSAFLEFDPLLKIDRLTTAILEFENGTSMFTCSTQMTNFQYTEIFGSGGRIRIEKPFTPPADKPANILLQQDEDINIIPTEIRNQYTEQGDQFSLSIINDTEVPTPLSDALANMKVIDKIFESAKSGTWINI